MYSKKGTAPPWVPVPLFRLQVVQNREREESFVASAKSRRTESGADGAVTLVDP